MAVKEITTADLRKMNDRGGLVFQGCGGEVQEWIDGINDLLEKENILENGTKFENVERFDDGHGTCILFPFSDEVKLNMGKLAIWRIKTNDSFGSMWLSDYVNINLGGFDEMTATNKAERKKPNCALVDKDGNIFNLMGIASRTLRRAGMSQEAQEMSNRIMGGEAQNYHQALGIICEYVNVTSGDEELSEGLNEDNDIEHDEGFGFSHCNS